MGATLLGRVRVGLSTMRQARKPDGCAESRDITGPFGFIFLSHVTDGERLSPVDQGEAASAEFSGS